MNTRIVSLFDSLVLILLLCGCSEQSASSPVVYHDVGANIWHLEIESEGQIVTADYKGNVALRDLKSRSTLWSHATGEFVFDLEVADLEGDGKPETAVVTASGKLIVLDDKGEEVWRYSSDLALFNVEVGNFVGGPELEVVCGGVDRFVYFLDAKGGLIAKSTEMQRVVHRLAAGNLNEDDYDELLVIEARTIAQMIGFVDDELVSHWRKELRVPAEMMNWENPQAWYYPFSLEIDDIDGDGDSEILMGDTYFNRQAVQVADHNAETIWISERLPGFAEVDGHSSEFYSTAFVRASDIFPEIDGKEIISVAGSHFRMWDKDGNVLGEKNTAPGFTDIELVGNRMLLGSAPSGDEIIYEVALTEAWEETLARLTFHGKLADIKADLAKLREQVLQLPTNRQSDQVYTLQQLGFFRFEIEGEGADLFRSKLAAFRERFPYDNIRPIYTLKVIEDSPPLDENGEMWNEWRWNTDTLDGTMTVDAIVEKARWIEAQQIPTVFRIGHGCTPFVTVETVEKILQAAPNYCLGFVSHEDEQLNVIPRYFHHYFQHVADLCLEYGNKTLMTKNKGLWWVTSPSDERVFDALFAGGRSNVSLASTEDSNSRTPELNLLARGGLWQSGLLKHNDVSIHRDLFSFNRFHQWEYPRSGHPYIRLLVAHATLGMTQISDRIFDMQFVDGELKIHSDGAESTEIFYHMVGKGIVFSPAREDSLGWSPVGIAVHKPPLKFLRDAHNGHAPELWQDDAELHNAILPHNGNPWGMTQTPDHALQKVLLNKERQFGYQLPATPYGLVAFVPAHADLDDVAGIEEWWHTDGIYVWKEGGPKLTGDEAAAALQADFAQAAYRMPFRQTGEPVFMQVVRLKENAFRLFLVDPGWADPKEHVARIAIQLEGNFTARDVLSNEALDIMGNELAVTVPAGLLRIIDVTILGTISENIEELASL